MYGFFQFNICAFVFAANDAGVQFGKRPKPKKHGANRVFADFLFVVGAQIPVAVAVDGVYQLAGGLVDERWQKAPGPSKSRPVAGFAGQPGLADLFQIHGFFPHHAAKCDRVPAGGAQHCVAYWYFVLHVPVAVV